MKHPMASHFFVRSVLGIALGLCILALSTLHSAEPAKKEGTMAGTLMDRCKEMQEHRQKAMAGMKTQDAELAAQVVAMNGAPETKKLALMAAILTRMVEQRTAMHQRQEKMHGEMLEHMMQHARMGGDSTSQCPMMQGMDDGRSHADMGHKPAAM